MRRQLIWWRLGRTRPPRGRSGGGPPHPGHHLTTGHPADLDHQLLVADHPGPGLALHRRVAGARDDLAAVLLSSSAATEADAVFKIAFPPAQLTVLPLEIDQTPSVTGGRTGLGPGIDLGLLDPAPQRVTVDAQLITDPAARPGHRQLQIRIHTQILDQTDHPVAKLDRVLPWCWHDSTLPWDQCLRQTGAVQFRSINLVHRESAEVTPGALDRARRVNGLGPTPPYGRCVPTGPRVRRSRSDLPGAACCILGPGRACKTANLTGVIPMFNPRYVPTPRPCSSAG